MRDRVERRRHDSCGKSRALRGPFEQRRRQAAVLRVAFFAGGFAASTGVDPGFLVLRETTMPSVLIETGFLNNPSEGAFISSRAGQETIAESILLAFKRYKNTVENSPKVQAEAQKAAKMPYTEGVVFSWPFQGDALHLIEARQWSALRHLFFSKKIETNLVWNDILASIFMVLQNLPALFKALRRSIFH